MRTERISNAFRAFFKMCAEISYSGFTQMAPTVTPLAPAFFFGFAIGTAVLEKTGSAWMAGAVGIAAAAGLEAAGFMAFRSALHVYRQVGWRAAILPVLYLAIGITSLWTVEGVRSPETAVIGTALFLLAACVYAARMTVIEVRAAEASAKRKAAEARRDQDDAEARRIEAEEREWERRQQEIAAQRQHELALKREERESRLELARIQHESQHNAGTMPAQASKASYRCDVCGANAGSNGKPFRTQAAVNAHKRFCTGAPVVSVNGRK